MIICGIKLTHDGGVALIDNNVLKFSVEIEKLDNNARYSSISDLSYIADILAAHNYSIDDVDHFVIDGWHGTEDNWRGRAFIPTQDNGQKQVLEVATYNELSLKDDVLQRHFFEGGFVLDGVKRSYSSYMHVSGHIMSAYCTSPFAQRGESSFILSWDGGQYPRLYYFDVERKRLENLGHLFFFLGTAYSIIPQYFGPYKKSAAQMEEEERRQEIEGYFGGYSVAGKIMSYIAYGEVKPELLEIFKEVYTTTFEVSNQFEHKFARAVKSIAGERFKEDDILASFHFYLQELLLQNLRAKVAKFSTYKNNLCYVGGCALNIKWNSAIRQQGLFTDVWVPPFVNDSGSALGTACCEMFFHTKQIALAWSPYSGPMIKKSAASPGWESKPCTIGEVAQLIFESGEPVIVLHGKAELGPRALGHRSIISPAVSKNMKAILNDVKKREHFRPVAPICLEAEAPRVFEPGSPDPYMLFEHVVRNDWSERVPAICHIDGTARVQTVNKDQDALAYTLLEAYYKLSGIPLLCNTSANLNGSGFFPDVASATEWGRLNYVWCDNILYQKSVRNIFD